MIHKHVVNSCSYYFVCTYDSSKNKLWYSTDPDCVEQMILSLYIISGVYQGHETQSRNGND